MECQQHGAVGIACTHANKSNYQADPSLSPAWIILDLSFSVPASLHPINKGKKAHKLYKKTKSISM